MGHASESKKSDETDSIAEDSYADLTISDATAGDVIVLAHASEMGEDISLTVEERHEYDGSLGKWSELAGDSAGETRHLEINSDDGLTVLLSDPQKIRLGQLNISEDDLVRMDETIMTKKPLNTMTARSVIRDLAKWASRRRSWRIRRYYLWDFATDDERFNLSIEKWKASHSLSASAPASTQPRLPS